MSSKRDLPIEAIRFKLFRVEQGLTQKEMAAVLETNQSIADIERSRVRISGSIIEALVRCYNLNPSWLFGKSNKKYLVFTMDTKPPLIVTTDSSGNENIAFVSDKAYAGYTDNLHNPDWFVDLPSFSLPIPTFKNDSLRCFQIEGDSMKGVIEHGEYALCRYVEGPYEWKEGNIYIVVTADSILCKRIGYNRETETLALISINTDYPIQYIDTQCVQEIWEVKGKISPDIKMYFPEVRNRDVFIELQHIRQDISNLEKKITIS